jgi:hypothetical protein
MAGLDPAIYAFLWGQDVDAGDNRGHDEGKNGGTRPMADMANGG